MRPIRFTAAYNSDNLPPSAFNSTQHTSPSMPKNIRSGKPPAPPIVATVLLIVIAGATVIYGAKVGTARHHSH